jgi:hypothetical protein
VHAQVPVCDQGQAVIPGGLHRALDSTERRQQPSLPESANKLSLLSEPMVPREEIVDQDQASTGKERTRRGGEKGSRCREVDKRLDGEREMKRMQTGDAREIRFEEQALCGETPHACLMPGDSGLAGADGDPDTSQRRVDRLGEEQQAASNPAADVENPKLSTHDRRCTRPGLLRDEAVHVVDSLLEGFDPVGHTARRRASVWRPIPSARKSLVFFSYYARAAATGSAPEGLVLSRP